MVENLVDTQLYLFWLVLYLKWRQGKIGESSNFVVTARYRYPKEAKFYQLQIGPQMKSKVKPQVL